MFFSEFEQCAIVIVGRTPSRRMLHGRWIPPSPLSYSLKSLLHSAASKQMDAESNRPLSQTFRQSLQCSPKQEVSWTFKYWSFEEIPWTVTLVRCNYVTFPDKHPWPIISDHAYWSERFPSWLFLSEWMGHWTAMFSFADKLQCMYKYMNFRPSILNPDSCNVHSVYISLPQKGFLCICLYINMSYDVSHLPIPSMQNKVSFVYKISYIIHERKIFKSGWGRNLRDRNRIIIYKTHRSCASPVNMIISWL
jgi:hypothetical protein